MWERIEAVWGKSWYFDAFKLKRSENSKGWSLIVVMEESFRMESISLQLKCLPFPVRIIFGFCFVASLCIILNWNTISISKYHHLPWMDILSLIQHFHSSSIYSSTCCGTCALYNRFCLLPNTVFQCIERGRLKSVDNNNNNDCMQYFEKEVIFCIHNEWSINEFLSN